MNKPFKPQLIVWWSRWCWRFSTNQAAQVSASASCGGAVPAAPGRWV